MLPSFKRIINVIKLLGYRSLPVYDYIFKKKIPRIKVAKSKGKSIYKAFEGHISPNFPQKKTLAIHSLDSNI